MTHEGRRSELLRPEIPSLASRSPGGLARDRLVRGIVGTAGLFGVGYLALYLAWGAGPVLAEQPWFNAMIYVCHLLAASTVAFLALGRYRVLQGPVCYWIGVGFAGYSILVVFYILTWPGLLPARVLTSHSNSAAWLVMLAWSLLAGCLLAAADSRGPSEWEAHEGRGVWSLGPWLGAFTLTGLLVVVGDRALPALVTPAGGWTGPAWAWQALLALAYAVGVVLSTRRYRHSGDTLPGYVALSQLVLAFGIGGMLLGGKRYDVWWYLARFLGVGGFLAMMVGLLTEYVTLFRREQERTREAQEQAAALQRAEAALRRLNEELEGRVQDRTVSLRQQEEWLRVTLTSIGDAVLATDTAGWITFLNPVAEALTGWPQGEAAGRPVHDVFRIVNERTHQPAEDLVARVLSEGRAVTLANHTALLARDGREIPIEDSAAPIRDSAGRVAGVVVVFHDVTEKRRAQDALQSVARFPDENPHPVLRVTRDGTLLYANRSSEPLLRMWNCQVGERLPAAWGTRVTDLYAHGRVEEVDVTCADRVYSCTLTPIANSEYLNIYARDITLRKQAEAALQQAQAMLEERVQARTAELAQVVAARDRQAEQLRALAAELTRAEQRERRRLATRLHDEHQQLLAAAKLRVSLLAREEGPQLQAACRELTALLQEALAHARSLAQELSPPILATGNLAGALEWLARWMAEKHHLQVAVQADPTALPESDDLTVLCFQAVRELLFNVVKHAQVPTAQVALSQRDGEVQLCVADAGVGFDPTFLRMEGGVLGGFGLFSIRQRVELLGGRLAIASAPGQGTRVTLTVPLRASPAVAPPVPGPPTAAPAPPARPGKLRVLVVDDHQLVRQGLIRLLAAEPDLEIVGEAADGLAAVAMARALHPDVVTMDVSMPGMNGIDATGRITAACAGIRVIGLSMFEEPAQAAAMRAAGAVAYLPKSGPAEALLAALRAGRTEKDHA